MFFISKDFSMRRVQITINNPIKHGFDHERIKEEFTKIKSTIYYIMADEIGGKEETHHTHIYAVFRNPVRFSTLKNRFPTAHFEKTRGTHTENIDYVTKTGKWSDDPKKDTSIPNSTYSYGDRPIDGSGNDEKLNRLFGYIKDGYTDYEILLLDSDFLFDLDKIQRARIAIKSAEYQDTWRDIECIYVFGETNTNKTRTYMEKYGYSNVYRVTNYVGNAVWDGYRGQDVVIFEEYRSQITISEMLTWIEGYPNSCLRARYVDKAACFTKVVFISNIPLERQYKNVQEDSPETWRAFIRRIQRVYYHKSREEIIEYSSVEEYLHRNEKFHDISPEEAKEIDDIFSNLDGEQDVLPFE